MLKAELEQEVNRLRDVIMNAEKCFEHLSDEQKNEIDQIFNDEYNPAKPATRFHAIGMIAAYILRGQL